MRTPLIALALALASLSARSASASSILLNGDFETGDFTAWTVVNSSVSVLLINGSHPHSGSESAIFGGVNLGGGDEDAILQTMATVAGQSYTIDFWLEDQLAGTCDVSLSCLLKDFSAAWNGTPLLSLVSNSPFGYTGYSFTVLATGPASTLSFAAANEPGYYRLDDISVNASVPPPVPEPASLLCLATGLAFAARRAARDARPFH